MATNKRVQAKGKANRDKSDKAIAKMLTDFAKVRATGDVRPHYIPGGQAFTTGEKKE